LLKIKRIDHVGVCVADLDQAQERLQHLLGLSLAHRELVESQETEAAFLPVCGAGVAGAAGGSDEPASIELIAPRGNASLERFLEKRGPGLHHLAIEVEGIEEALHLLKGLGVPLIDEAPRPGARGHKVAFLHPRAAGGVLIELIERGGSRTE
jgi:methylmalonyl-CoA/ethylmalonyl-CoA epimerase